MVKLTKKFENEGMVGQDPAQGLQRALDRQNANVCAHCNPCTAAERLSVSSPLPCSRNDTVHAHYSHTVSCTLLCNYNVLQCSSGVLYGEGLHCMHTIRLPWYAFRADLR